MPLIGHENLIRDFKALAGDRKLSQGYIFFGVPRLGKRSFAMALANHLENGEFAEPAANRVLSDALLIGPGENRTIGIDPIRDIKIFLWQMPNASPYRTVIIDGGERLTDEAQNALLKITEEPPAAALLILVADDPEKLRPTLQSRFQKVYFSPVPVPLIERWLKTELRIPADKAKDAAERSAGQPGLAKMMLTDESFNERHAAARKFLSAPASGRSLLLKDILVDEHFDLDLFVEALMIAAYSEHKRDKIFWHAASELRRQASYFNLNPRIQLLNLAKTLNINE